MESERLCLSVPAAAKEVGLSKSLVYDLIKANQFPHVHWGEKRVTVPIEGLRTYLKRKTDGAGQAGSEAAK